MLSLFKTNNPSVVIIYIFYLILFRICFAFVPADPTFVFEYREPLSQALFGFLKNLDVNYRILSLILSASLCFFQALLINKIVNDNKILPRKNYIAGLFFVIFSSFFKESLVFSPASLALTFLIICTGNIFSLIKKDKPDTAIFDVGFMIAIATLFYFPILLFLIFAYIGLAIVRPFVYREWIMIMLGFISPFIVVFTFYFWNDNTGRLLPDIVNSHSQGWLQVITMSHVDWILIGSVSLVVLALLTLLPSALYSGLIQVRKFSTVLVLLIFFTGISFSLQQSISLSHMVLLGLPLSIISSIVLVQIKNKMVSEVIHLILLLLILARQFLPLFNFN